MKALLLIYSSCLSLKDNNAKIQHATWQLFRWNVISDVRSRFSFVSASASSIAIPVRYMNYELMRQARRCHGMAGVQALSGIRGSFPPIIHNCSWLFLPCANLFVHAILISQMKPEEIESGRGRKVYIHLTRLTAKKKTNGKRLKLCNLYHLYYTKKTINSIFPYTRCSFCLLGVCLNTPISAIIEANEVKFYRLIPINHNLF